MKKKPLLEIVCSGSPYKLGEDQGFFVREHADQVLKSLLESEFVSSLLRIAGPQVLKAVLALKGFSIRFPVVSSLKDQIPRQWERMRGLADGSGLGINAMLGLANIEAVSAQFYFIMGCISMGLGKSHSRTRTPLIAYNHDFPGLFRKHLLMRRSQPDDGYESLQLSYPLLTGSICGVNEKGVAVTLNHAYSKESLGYFDSGIPPTLGVQEILDRCATVDEAIDLIRRIRFGCGSMITVMDTRKMCALEFSRSRFGIRRSKDGFLLTLNAYQLEQLQAVEVPQKGKYDPKKFPKSFHGIFVHEHNWQRQKRCEELSVKTKVWKVSGLKKLLSDHKGLKTGNEGTICRHHPTSETIASAILYPKERRMEVSRGHACQAHYQEFSL